jgi:flagellar biosynthetic protein FliQ
MGGSWACPARRAGWGEPDMNPDLVGQLAREALETTLFLSLPILGIGLIVGLLVSLFQAVTQIQEATLVFVPKIVVVFLALLVLSPWMMRKMMFYTEQLIVNLPQFVK